MTIQIHRKIELKCEGGYVSIEQSEIGVTGLVIKVREPDVGHDSGGLASLNILPTEWRTFVEAVEKEILAPMREPQR